MIALRLFITKLLSRSPLEFPDKIQSKIWANEYIDLGTLLHTTSPTDSKYNFVVQTTHSADRPAISLDPAQKKNGLPQLING